VSRRRQQDRRTPRAASTPRRATYASGIATSELSVPASFMAVRNTFSLNVSACSVHTRGRVGGSAARGTDTSFAASLTTRSDSGVTHTRRHVRQQRRPWWRPNGLLFVTLVCVSEAAHGQRRVTAAGVGGRAHAVLLYIERRAHCSTDDVSIRRQHTRAATLPHRRREPCGA
jgi:hypothetical protein